jgi:RNA polymerase sigma-70 factor, ECF subfamily
LKENLYHIIENCKKGYAHSQEALYKQCYPEMMKVCIRFESVPDDAASIYNNAMFKVFQQIHKYKGEADFMAWVRRIVVNTAIDHYRGKVKFRTEELKTIEDMPYIEPQVYSKISAIEVLKILQELPPSTALVFKLFSLEDFSHEEIAKKLGISVGTSKWHVSEARKLLKQKMTDKIVQKMFSNG